MASIMLPCFASYDRRFFIGILEACEQSMQEIRDYSAPVDA